MQVALRPSFITKMATTNWTQIEQSVSKHQPHKFIVGLPLNKDNKNQEMTFIARSFGKKLEQAIQY